MKEVITWEMFEKKVDELCEMVSELKEGRPNAAEYACVQVVCFGADNHYEGLGILQEAMLVWRKLSMMEMPEDEDPETAIVH
jgi:hypothetical protein